MYQEQARRHGQDISTTTDDGTFAGGLRHITSVLPSLLNDIIQHAPDAQKVINLNTSKESVRRNAKNFFLFLFFFHHIVLFHVLTLFPPLFSWNCKLSAK